MVPRPVISFSHPLKTQEPRRASFTGGEGPDDFIRWAGGQGQFVGLALLWQIIFVLIAKDPMRYRPIMPIAILEKFVYSVPVVILYSLGEIHAKILGASLGDPVFGLLFIAAYLWTRDAAIMKKREHA